MTIKSNGHQSNPHHTHLLIFEEILKIHLTKKYTDVINYIVETGNK